MSKQRRNRRNRRNSKESLVFTTNKHVFPVLTKMSSKIIQISKNATKWKRLSTEIREMSYGRMPLSELSSTSSRLTNSLTKPTTTKYRALGSKPCDSTKKSSSNDTTLTDQYLMYIPSNSYTLRTISDFMLFYSILSGSLICI